jgi:uncharacterized membrane protein (DUF2068 family)
MSTAAQRSGDPASYRGDKHGHGEGWVMFAGIILMIAGTLNFVYGIAAIANSHFYAANTHYVISDLKTWGWVVMLLGVLQLCVAMGVWVRAAWARWTGVLVAALNALAQLIFIASYPLLSLSIVALDILVIYGLVTYGSREPERA